MKIRGIEEISGNEFRVQGSGDNVYTVRYCGSGDGDPEFIGLWECDCPASRYRPGLCKHAKSVIAALDESETDK